MHTYIHTYIHRIFLDDENQLPRNKIPLTNALSTIKHLSDANITAHTPTHKRFLWTTITCCIGRCFPSSKHIVCLFVCLLCLLFGLFQSSSRLNMNMGPKIWYNNISAKFQRMMTNLIGIDVRNQTHTHTLNNVRQFW